MQLDFFDIDIDYIEYLRNYETAQRGFSPVPFLNYEANRKQKFFCGAVFKTALFDYFVPVSSRITPHDNTFYLYTLHPHRRIASLRFDYMLPVPPACVTRRIIMLESQPGYRRLMQKELYWCRKNQNAIVAIAERTHARMVSHEQGWQQSCDFTILERACMEYCLTHGLDERSLDSGNSSTALEEIIKKARFTAEPSHRDMEAELEMEME